MNKGQKAGILDNVLAIVFGSILAIFEWNTIYKEGWYLYFVVLVIICCIAPFYSVIKNSI